MSSKITQKAVLFSSDKQIHFSGAIHRVDTKGGEKDAPAPLTPVKTWRSVRTLAQPSERLRIDQGINQITQ